MPKAVYFIHPNVESTFWKRVDKNGPVIREDLGPCWLWTGYRMKTGYGQANPHGLAHRWSWQINRGPIPTGKQVLHRCDNPGCVNPEHLWVGSINDNMQDKVRKGRQSRGEAQGANKLTEEQVREIRRRYKRYSHKDGTGALAKEYGVCGAQIFRIAHNQHWKHVCL